MVSAWTPIRVVNEEEWKALDALLVRLDDNDQVVTTASNMIVHGKVFVEVSSSQVSGFHFDLHPGVLQLKCCTKCCQLRKRQTNSSCCIWNSRRVRRLPPGMSNVALGPLKYRAL